MMAARDLPQHDVAVTIAADHEELGGRLDIPARPVGLVLALGAGAPAGGTYENGFVAALGQRRIGTLLLALAGESEPAPGLDVLVERLMGAIAWSRRAFEPAGIAIGLHAVGPTAAVAFRAAALEPTIAAIVCRSGRVDLAGDAVERVKTPTLFIVGERDHALLALNRNAFARIHAAKKLAIIPDASHLFSEAGVIATASRMAVDWFANHVKTKTPAAHRWW